MTQGRCWGQLAAANRARSESFNRRWNLSTAPLDWGWNAVVSFCLMPSLDITAAQKEEVN
jgi:hypothetical protein